jgi:7-keto-8-aminopelargonate synthetase-like enzyme
MIYNRLTERERNDATTATTGGPAVDIFTTAPAPAAAATLTALEIIQNEPQRRHCLKQNTNALRRILSQSGLNIGNSTTHILPVIVGSAEKTVKIAQKLLAEVFCIKKI